MPPLALVMPWETAASLPVQPDASGVADITVNLSEPAAAARATSAVPSLLESSTRMIRNSPR